MRRAIIVHCWDGRPDYGWYPWLQRELERQGFVVEVPAMQDPHAPKQDVWVPQLAGVVGDPDEDTYLIGHSVGCITILRYLETLTDIEKVGGVLLVAGFTDDLGYAELANYFTTPIDWGRIRSRADGFAIIHSDNDAYVPTWHAGVFEQHLGVEGKLLHGRHHFDEEHSVRELPEARDAVLALAGMR